MVKIGGTLGKITEKVKENVKGGKVVPAAVLPVKAGYDWLSGQVESRQAQKTSPQERAAQDQAVREAAAASAADPNNFSSYGRDYAKYVAQFGDNAGTKDAFYSDTTKNAFGGVLGDIQNLKTNVNIDPTFRNYQMQLAQQLQNQAMGQGPSLAQMQLQQATDRTLNQSLGAIKSGLGGQNAALAARTAALASSQQLAGMGQQSGMLRLQEQQQAQDALGRISASAYGQDSANALAIRQQQIGAVAQQADMIQQSLGGFDATQKARLGIQAQEVQAKQAEKAAQRAAENQVLGSLATAGATAAGSYFGGPAGGAAANETAKRATSRKG